MMEKILWKKPAVVMGRNDTVADALVGEDTEPEKFALEEFPKNLRGIAVPGFAFWWSLVEDDGRSPARFHRIERREN